ncbi:hypothetical protein MML48_2g00018722 [Holotrichia oblita]|uniref:Uncharacterized protein n=1 Tax=Holotrichia oblita TaxID=644536 RepID=A0ACB9TMT1_HOLOL|nr:hypothetical protein MML48_2g00018722 [Holotrichia oblita]
MNVFGEDSDDDFLNNDLEIFDIVEFRFPRNIYLRFNHFEDLDNLTFFQRFRLTKDTVMNILPQVEHLLEYPLDISYANFSPPYICFFFQADSGYALSNYVLTLLLNANTTYERLYNEAHIRSRNMIERLFGVWKHRFPILAYDIRVKLYTAFTIIIACAVLHNIAFEMHEDDSPLPPEENAEVLANLINEGNVHEENVEYVNLPNLTRNEIINYFHNLL